MVIYALVTQPTLNGHIWGQWYGFFYQKENALAYKPPSRAELQNWRTILGREMISGATPDEALRVFKLLLAERKTIEHSKERSEKHFI